MTEEGRLNKVNNINVIKVFFVVLTYWTVSISLVFANKFLVGGAGDTDVSLFIAWVQCIITVLIGVFISIVISFINPLSSSTWGALTKLNWSSIEMSPLFKMSFCFVLMLAFNNMCLKLVGVSFYQVARSMTIIFVVILSIIILKRSVSKPIIACCSLVAGGFFLGVNQEGSMNNFSVTGVIYGVVSSIFIALTGIYTKQALPSVDKNELKLTVCMNLLASVIFVPVLIISGEYIRVYNSERLISKDFWMCLSVSSILGFALSWISAVQINVTSPVSHHVSANCKAILQTLIAVIYYKETKGALWWFSVCLVVFGACAYAIRRYKEEERDKNSLPITDIHIPTSPETSK